VFCMAASVRPSGVSAVEVVEASAAVPAIFANVRREILLVIDCLRIDVAQTSVCVVSISVLGTFSNTD